MPVRSDDPLRKVTLNLYERDCETMEKWYGHGWTTVVRQMIHTHITSSRDYPTIRRTLGDLE